MTVRENLEFPLRRHKDKIENFQGTEILVKEALENVGLAHAIDLMPAELSGGMQRRVALARALILKPKIIMYDEPTTGLDPITAKEIILVDAKYSRKISYLFSYYHPRCGLCESNLKSNDFVGGWNQLCRRNF